MIRKLLGLVLLSATLALPVGAVRAQDGAFKWQFSQNFAAGGQSTASLSFGVPETDNAQFAASCGAGVPPGQAEIIVSVNFGNLKPGTFTRLRFSGGGKEYELNGKVHVPASGEGITGVRAFVANASPLWGALSAGTDMSYQIPGYAPTMLKVAGGRNAIQNFSSACRFFAQNAQTPPQPQPPAQPQPPVQPQQPVQAPPPTPPQQPVNLPFLDLGPANSPWFNGKYQSEGSPPAFAAIVRARGVSLTAWCSRHRRLNFVIAENGRNTYPAFQQRFEQASRTGKLMRARSATAGDVQMSFQYQGLSGEVLITQEFSPTGPFVTGLMKDRLMALSVPPFGATFQLQNSRKALCNVLNACGARVPGCAPRRPVVNTVPQPPVIKRQRCRARSVWVEGRGCVLRRHVNTIKRNRGCARGKIRFEGRCLFRHELRSFCGPGFTPRGTRCVSNARLQPRPPKRRGNGCARGKIRFEGRCLFRHELRSFCGPGFTPRGTRCVSNARLQPRPPKRRIQQGVFVTEAHCRRQGLIKEGNYCVEND